MTNTLLKSAACLAIAGLAWGFIGVERIVGDHEVGNDWTLFVKRRPSLRIRFDNPAQAGLDIVAPQDLSAARRAAFIDFCAVRFGITDVARCHALVVARRL